MQCIKENLSPNYQISVELTPINVSYYKVPNSIEINYKF